MHNQIELASESLRIVRGELELLADYFHQTRNARLCAKIMALCATTNRQVVALQLLPKESPTFTEREIYWIKEAVRRSIRRHDHSDGYLSPELFELYKKVRNWQCT